MASINKRKRVDTIALTGKLDGFKRPPFQREIKVNKKLLEIAEEIKATGVFPGILTVGIFKGDQYIIDGQHRFEAVRISERQDVLADVHYLDCESMAEMADHYVELNSSIVRFGPDDILKGMESSVRPLKYIREQCGFVGYGQVRRSEKAPILSMSRLLRAWFSSGTEVPRNGGESAASMAERLDQDTAQEIVLFLRIVEEAWGRDAAYVRLWNGMNLILSMWLYRRTVLDRGATNRSKITPQLFRKAMMALSADEKYMDWLMGRQMNEQNRGPAYNRLKAVVQDRLHKETGLKQALPQPPWAHHQSGAKLKLAAG